MLQKNSDFEEVERLLFLNSANQIKPGLERIKNLLANLDNPQNFFPVLHVVGTNGKGSTSAFLESILRESGYKTAFYSSPHLESPAERLLINSSPLDSKTWLEAVKTAIKSLNENPKDKTSYFELLTAAAFILARNSNVDVGIIEAGLGGRLDATNLSERVECSVITSISMDHMEYLGNSLEEIASEKFAVIRKSKPAVFSGKDESLIKLFRDLCREKNSHGLVLTQDSKISNLKITSEGNDFDFYSENLTLKNVHTNLLGNYQVQNAALALLAVSCVKDSFPKITDDSILKGVRNASWKGRLEIISKNPLTVLDGGHNPDGVKNLVQSVKNLWHDKKIGIVYAVMKDKDYESCLKLLNELNASFYATCVTNMQRSLTLEELLKACKKFSWRNVPLAFNDSLEAVRQSQQENELTIICGSLYLIGSLRSKI